MTSSHVNLWAIWGFPNLWFESDQLKYFSYIQPYMFYYEVNQGKAAVCEGVAY